VTLNLEETSVAKSRPSCSPVRG